MLLADKWNDYKIIDCGDGEKLERIGNFLISRPDSQVIWAKQKKQMGKFRRYLSSFK